MIKWQDGDLVISEEDRKVIERISDRFLDFMVGECKGKVGPIGGVVALAWSMAGTLATMEENNDEALVELFQAEFSRLILTARLEPHMEWDVTHEGSEQIN